jgi:RimJ/RimL family protein N-acetyltransferase
MTESERMTKELTWAPYLRDDMITFRPPEESDAEDAFSWHESPIPLTQAKALESLQESETMPWGLASTIRLIAGTLENGQVVGGVRIDRHEQRVESLEVTPSRSLEQETQREIAVRMMNIVVPWLVDEVAVLSILLKIPDDDLHLIEALGLLGFERVATYREHLLRPGGRVDLHLYQLLNPNWILPTETSDTNA